MSKFSNIVKFYRERCPHIYIIESVKSLYYIFNDFGIVRIILQRFSANNPLFLHVHTVAERREMNFPIAASIVYQPSVDSEKRHSGARTCIS